MTDYEILLYAQIMIALALFLATAWYAYHTRRLAKQQENVYLLDKKIWKESHIPRLWFYLSRTSSTRIYLNATNLGGDVAINIIAEIKTKTVEFIWKWPSILPKEQVHIDLPHEINHVENLGNMEYLKINADYLDSASEAKKISQRIDTNLMAEGMQTSHQSSKNVNDNQQ